MKILQVIHDFVDSNKGGSELYTYYLSRELGKNHEVSILYYCNEYNWQDGLILKSGKIKDLSIYTINIPTSNLYHWSILNYKNSRVDKLFENVLQRFEPDIIQFQHLLFSSMNFPNIAKRRRIPCIHTLHDYYLICPCTTMINQDFNRSKKIERAKCFKCILKPYSRKDLVQKLGFGLPYCAILFYHLYIARNIMVRKVFKNIDMFISPSEFLKDVFIRFGIPKDKIIHLSNGMNYEIMNNKHVVKNNTGHPLTFAYIGGHQTEKGIPLLIKAFNPIKNAQLYIYGTGREKEYLQMITNPNISLKGFIYDEEKSEVFSKINVLIVPSLMFENSPLTIQEAFMFNVPVITSNIGGMKELVANGINGLHFKVGDVEDLRHKIKYFVDNQNEIQRMGENVPKIKSIQENAMELENIYQKLILNT